MGRTSTFETGLIMTAFLVVAAVIGLLLLAPALEDLPASVSVPKIQQATEQEMEKAWENLASAISRQDQDEANRLAQWLDEQRGFIADDTEHAWAIHNWCALNDQKWDFCKEENNE